MHLKTALLETNGYSDEERGFNMITRDGAIETLYSLINSDVLSDEIEGQLEDIAKCIQAEDSENDLGLFLWGADDDYVDLYVARREDLIDDAWNKHQQELFEKYRIKEGD